MPFRPIRVYGVNNAKSRRGLKRAFHGRLSLLREFVVLSQTLNYTKAAGNIAHSHSRRFQAYRRHGEGARLLGFLERDRRRVELTESGNVFAAAALQMVDTYDDAKQRICDIQTLTRSR